MVIFGYSPSSSILITFKTTTTRLNLELHETNWPLYRNDIHFLNFYTSKANQAKRILGT